MTKLFNADKEVLLSTNRQRAGEGNCNLNRRGKLTIQKRIPFANDVYFSMVDNTLNIRQISTNMNL